MGQNEEAAWWEQFKYWEDRRDILKTEKKFWEMKLAMLRSEQDYIANTRRGW